ncbi:uncharacterized protein LOC110723533 [Chenopodium quinoa]|uniref:uncharacterized protein LOC110723533 n=1 Tax=Chenopodium quinoa TaxID=63459 RepID=UPI000B798A22|nr:uncharacterized protein LOC110723533 [Chenopodium quinoa]
MIIEEREEFMLSINSNQTPSSRIGHFLKPTFKPKNETLPKPPSLPSFSLKSNIKQLLKRKVSFKGRPKPQKNWDTWVQNLQKTHQNTWKKVGIFDAIKASTYVIKWDKNLIFGLAGNWCSETNTFVFSCGECSITLEDVMILGGFSVLGEGVKTPFENIKIVEFGEEMLQNFMKNRRILGPVGHTEWMSYFMGIGGELEHVAFLSLWLSRYVFSTNHYCKISQDVFPIAIYLARVSSALGWERFPTLGPSPINILDGEPRLSRWRKLERPNLVCVMLDFESLGKSFVWRPYGICVENWQFPKFYGDEERLVLVDFGVGEELLSFARCLRTCELLGLDSIEQYLPHRTGMQFGLDQDVPRSVPRSNEGHLAAWNSYDISLNGLKLYLSPRLLKGDVTARYSDWFRTALCVSSNSVSVLKKQRSHSSRPRVTFKLSKASDGSTEGNGKRAPICPTSPFDVPLASCSTHSVGVGEMRIKDDSSYEKINIKCLEGMTSQSTSKVAVVESQDFAASTEDYSKQTPVCLPSLSNVFDTPGFVSNIEVVQNKTTACCSNISFPNRSYVENSRYIPSECPKKLKNKNSPRI